MINNFRVVAYLSSQFSWILILLLIYAVVFFIKIDLRVKLPNYKSTVSGVEKLENFTSPLFFVHFTDIHINYIQPVNIPIYEKAIHNINKLDYDYVLTTGDLTNGCPYYDRVRYCYQSDKEWFIYKNLSSLIPSNKLIEVAGNHDMWGISSFYSKGNYFPKNRQLNKTIMQIDSFYINKRVITSLNNNKTYIFSINPFKFPSAHAPFNYVPRYSTDMLDKLEDDIKIINEEDNVIFISHFPLDFSRNTVVRSTNGYKFYDIITKICKGRKYYISGHSHPRETLFLRHDDILEIVGRNMKNTGNFGVFTLDHDKLVYTDANVNKLNTIFLTSPIPSQQIGPKSIYTEGVGYIRVIAFTKETPNIYATGDVNGKLECRNIDKKSGIICQIPYNFTEGSYNVTLNGDFSYKLHFSVGSLKLTGYQLRVEPIGSNVGILTPLMILFIVVTLFIVLPSGEYNFFPDYCKWLRFEKVGIHGWTISIFGSILVVKSRISTLPKWARMYLILIVIYPIILPHSFMNVEGRFGFLLIYGIFCNYEIHESPFCSMYICVYYGCVTIPTLLVASSIAENNSIYWWSYIEFIICMTGAVPLIHFVKFYVLESSGFLLTPFSPCFVIIPIFSVSFSIILRLSYHVTKRLQKKEMS